MPKGGVGRTGEAPSRGEHEGIFDSGQRHTACAQIQREGAEARVLSGNRLAAAIRGNFLLQHASKLFQLFFQHVRCIEIILFPFVSQA